MADPLGDSVTVTARLAPAGAVERPYGRTLYLHHTDAGVTDPVQAQLIRDVRLYSTAAAVTSDDQPAGVRAAANVYFQQEPYPNNLMVGSTIGAAQPAMIVSGAPGSVADIEALGDGVALSLNGEAVSANFNGDASYADIAAGLQAAIQTVTAHAAATCVYDADHEVFVFSDAAASFGTGFAESAAANTLGLGATAKTLERFTAAETPSEALTRIALLDDSFTFAAADPAYAKDASITNIRSFRDWVAARGYRNMTIIDLFGPEVLVTGESTSRGAVLAALGGSGIGGIYNGRSSDRVDHKGLSFLSRFSSINFDLPNSVLNGKFQRLPGTSPVALSETERAELRRKRINFYWPYDRNNNAETADGQTFGTWMDTHVFILWFQNALEVAGNTYLRQSAQYSGVPITNAGIAGLADALEDVCERAVRNGGLAPNAVSPAMRRAIQDATDNPEFDGFLSTGYLVIRPTAGSITQAVRDARGPIPIKIFTKGAGKINDLAIDVTFEQ